MYDLYSRLPQLHHSTDEGGAGLFAPTVQVMENKAKSISVKLMGDSHHRFRGTKMFRDYREKGLIRSYNWDDYFMYTTKPLFAHPNLTYQKVQEYMALGYRRAVFRNP
jgi:hypothetical protein